MVNLTGEGTLAMTWALSGVAEKVREREEARGGKRREEEGRGGKEETREGGKKGGNMDKKLFANAGRSVCGSFISCLTLYTGIVNFHS